MEFGPYVSISRSEPLTIILLAHPDYQITKKISIIKKKKRSFIWVNALNMSSHFRMISNKNENEKKVVCQEALFL